MVRETRHLWVGNLPENIREERIREHFKRYGRVQSVKLLPANSGGGGCRGVGDEKTSSGGEITMACTVAFMDIKSAAKAHNAELKIDDRTLDTEYYEPAAIPSSGASATASASPQNTPSPYSTSPVANAVGAAANVVGNNRFPNGHGPSLDEHVTASSFSDRFYERPAASSRLAAPSASAAPCVAAASSSASAAASSGYHHDAGVRSARRPAAYRNGPTSGPPPPLPPTGAATAPPLPGGRTGGAAMAGAATGPVNGGVAAAGTASAGGVGGWGYESSSSSSRYNSTSSNSQADTGYSTTPSDNNDRRNSDLSSKKKTKSRSGSRSPSPSGSTISRSPSRTRSRSSSSSSSSTTSRDTSSTGSPKSRRPASSSASATANHHHHHHHLHHHQPIVHSDDRRPLAICVRNLPVRSSDSSLKDGLFHEYKKHGKVTWVRVVGKEAERHAVVCFKKPEDVEKALEVSYDELFFGCKIEVAPYLGYDVDDNDQRPYEAEIDEYHPKATRTLFIGNLEKDVTASELRKHFDQFGEIIEIDVKKQGAVSSYAFCQYTDIASVVKAIRKMDGEHLGNNRIKLGFGKSMPYAIVWLDGVNEHVNDKYLKMQFETFGVVSKVYIDREKGQALVVFEQLLGAQAAVAKMRGFSLKGGKVQVDFASRECVEAFFERLDRQGVLVDRSIFEERSIGARGFEASNLTRFSRYCDSTATARARNSSYSSRSGMVGGGCVASMQSPGGGGAATPGSLTPRGGSSTSRSRRFAAPDFYESSVGGVTLDYGDGGGGSRHAHLRGYDEYSQGSAASHEEIYEHEYDFGRDNSSPMHVDQLVDAAVTFAPPDMRNLQKERVHLLEQLEECPSSGDEHVGPKKRIKLDLLDSTITSEVIIEANRDHRKVIEVRRSSDAGLKHHSSRRPSLDAGKHLSHAPHAVCKRRKTAGSDNGRPAHAHDRRSGSESAGGSRPGTPLCDERPENCAPSEPRSRVGAIREREGPLSLPLPRFAAQLVNRGIVSVAGIKGQKDLLSSPPPAVTSPRINPVTTVRPPSPLHHVPPPASPPPRPPSLGSSSSDSDVATRPPSPSLEERIRSLDEKYEKWSGSRALSAQGGDALALLDANLERFRQRHKILDLDLKEVQPSEIVKSVMAKRSVFDEDLKRLENVGEKYEPKEFSMYPKTTASIIVPPLAATPPLPPSTVKLPPVIAQLPKTPTSVSPRSTGSSLPAAKGLQYPFPTHPPIHMSPAGSTPPPPPMSSAPPARPAHDAKKMTSANKTPGSPRADVKTRRNSDTGGRRADEGEAKGKERAHSEERKRERFEKIKQENEKLERDKSERERVERERLEHERQEKIRVEKERLEKERLERESELERQRLEKERLEKERLEKEREERARKEREKQMELERSQRELEEKERREREEEIQRARKEREEKETQLKKEAQDEEWEQRRREDRHKDKDDNQERRKDEHHKHRDGHREIGISHKTSHGDRDMDRRKESVKENRDNNVHDKQHNKSSSESRHTSIDFDKSKSHSEKSDSSKRKERNNSLPAGIGSKRRLSGHDVGEPAEDKKLKLSFEHKKVSERRDSKDSARSEDGRGKSSSSKHNKNNAFKSHGDEKRREKEERHKKHKQKSKSKSREKEPTAPPPPPPAPKSPLTDKDFLNRLDLRPSDEVEKLQKEKESKRKNNNFSEEQERSKKLEVSKSRFDGDASMKMVEEKKKQRERIRKLTNSSDTDSDEPKKHSIFDIVDDEPAYISMYDKVKARSCKNMAKLEEEKRQEKLKAKFTQLKQSRAKREEKKRSTSWDEDSDYDKDASSETRIRRASKMLIDSTDDESTGRRTKEKKDTYSDSDCSGIMKHVKQEPFDTSDDEAKIKCMMAKVPKSRITSDTSEDEYGKKKLQHVKSELFSDVDDSPTRTFEEEEEEKRHSNNSMKDELERLIKKERRNSKHQESFNSCEPEKYSTSDEEANKKERPDRWEKKHKKKHRKQKHSVGGEEPARIESVSQAVPAEHHVDKANKHEKRKEHGRKEKRRDKTRDKPKKSKKSKSETKREGKMENIFGSLSEDSENGSKDADPIRDQKAVVAVEIETHHHHQAATYHSCDSDKEHEVKAKEKSEKDREREEHHRKRKEKRRREKERRLQEAVEEPNDNSMDFADMGKQLEANMMRDENTEDLQSSCKDIESSTFDNATDSFSFAEVAHEGGEHKKDKEERREGKERKKKRKRSKDEKSKHHHHDKHHHHHHDKSKSKSVEDKTKKEVPAAEEAKVEAAPPPTPPRNASLPTLSDEITPADKAAGTPDYPGSPSATVPLVPSTPASSKEKKREKFLPAFDETIHECAVKSISDFETTSTVNKKEDPAVDEDCSSEKSLSLPEEKPRVVISQEETEDAVAALLGESFGGGGKLEEFYGDDDVVIDAPEPLVEESNVQDDEEMRQAVQSLSANDIDAKPDTPQSEHELQIDTDTEEQEDSPVKFDQAAEKTSPEKTQLPKTPEMPYFRRDDDASSLSSMALKTPSNIGSPPSLTPIRPQATVKLLDIRKPAEVEQKSLPLLPDQTQRTVITQSWASEKKQEVVPLSQPSVIVMESKKLPVPVPPLAEVQHPNKAAAYTVPILKMAEPQYPPLKPLSKSEQPLPDLNSKLQVVPKPPPQMHNLPARSPVQINKPTISEQGMMSPKSPAGLIHNRLPITPVLASKPMQAATVKLQQSKVALPLEPPKLAAVDQRPRMVFQNAPQFSNFQPRMVIQGNIRHLPPQGLLVPTRQLAPQNYGYLSNIPHSAYGVSPIVKENVVGEDGLKLPHPSSVVNTPSSRVMINVPQHHVAVQPLVIPKEMTALGSPKQPLSSPSPKLMCHSPAHGSPKQSPRSMHSPQHVAGPQTLSVASPRPLSSPCPAPTSPNTKPVTEHTVISQTLPKQEVLEVVDEPKMSVPSPVIAPVIKESNDDGKAEAEVEEQPAKLAIEMLTDELNMSLEKPSPRLEVEPPEEKPEGDENKDSFELAQADTKVTADVPPTDAEDKPHVDSVKDAEKFDEEKADTESIVSDISKERPSSADILAKEDPLDTKEDSDYWSAKEVNIDSVIKTLCSADELSDRSSEVGKDEWFDDNTAKPETEQPPGRTEESVVPTQIETEAEDLEEPKEQVSPVRASSRNRGARGGRGRGKTRGGSGDRGGIQTRRGKIGKELAVAIPPANKRGRGTRTRNERKSVKSESDASPTDVYEFRDESDDANKERPRLILTIKSPAVSNANNVMTTAVIKEVTKDGAKEIGKEQQPVKELPVKPVEAKEEFTSPSTNSTTTTTTNTRKSRRLQEKDTRNTVDDTIEDVVKNTVQTRSSSNQRRSTRQTAVKPAAPHPETPRKSPRGRKLRRASEATETSSSEELIKDDVKSPPPPPTQPVKASEKLPEQPSSEPEPPKDKPFEGLKAAMLRRVKGEQINANPEEPTNLIDPVTGEIIPMRESEEGKYVPLPGDPKPAAASSELVKEVVTQPITVVQSPKPQSLKAHVLSSQAAQAVVSQQAKSTVVVPPPQHSVVVSNVGVPPLVLTKPAVSVPKTVTPIMMGKSVSSMVAAKMSSPAVVAKPVTPINQHLTINTSLSVTNPRPLVVTTTKSLPKQLVKQPLMSPVMLQKQQQQQQQILQASKHQQLLQLSNKAHLPMVNTQMAHVKQQVIVGGKGQMVKPMHPLGAAVPSPPMGSHASRILQPPVGAKVMEPPKVEVSLASVMMGQRPKLSPQGQQQQQQRLLGPTGVPMPLQANLGESIAHFPPGTLRQGPEISAHYIHAQYQQFYRQHQMQLNRSGGMEKVKDGQEGEEAPITSPPLELRRPGSVGLALTGRGAAVPHSLHSPHDRATDSPQVGQIYNMHPSRLPPYHPGRYYEPSEPPPAHRPHTSHGSLAGHMSPMGGGVPDRPIGAHAALAAHMADRPSLSSHAPPLLGGHGVMGGGLGAAGNLMGAVARHIGADAPTTQRGLQAATPPHASQVPPQAESLLMLLRQYPCMWQGLLALKNDQAAVQMYFVSGNDDVAKCSLPKNTDGSTPPLRIFQRMRLEQPQVEGVARKMQMENEHCMLLALPCGHDHMDVLKQSTNLTSGFITYLQQKQAAGIVNVAAPGTTQPPAYVVHIFPSCDFVNENLRRIAPSLLERVADIAHLLIVITTV